MGGGGCCQAAMCQVCGDLTGAASVTAFHNNDTCNEPRGEIKL